jgi:mannose-1-phosphate guanylyltransferase
VSIHKNSNIEPGAKIGPFVSIGANVSIGDGARIVNSIILEDATIKRNAVVINALIGWTAIISSWCRIEGVLTHELLGTDKHSRNVNEPQYIDPDL